MNAALTIAGLSVREAGRKRLVLVLLTLSALFVGFYLFGIVRLEADLDARALQAGITRTPGGSGEIPLVFATLFGLYLVTFLASLMSVLSTVGSVSGDIESGVMQSVVSRPVSRAGLIVGRWLGYLSINVGYAALMCALLLGGVYLLTGYAPPGPLNAVLLIVLSVALLTSLTVLGSTVFATIAAGIGVFVLYGVGWAGGMLQSVGTLADSSTMVRLGEVANTLMPTNALWLGASAHLLTPELREGLSRSPFPLPLVSAQFVAPGLVLWACVLGLLALGLAVWHFSRRDL